MIARAVVAGGTEGFEGRSGTRVCPYAAGTISMRKRILLISPLHFPDQPVFMSKDLRRNCYQRPAGNRRDQHTFDERRPYEPELKNVRKKKYLGQRTRRPCARRRVGHNSGEQEQGEWELGR